MKNDEAKRAEEGIKDASDDTPMFMSIGSVMVQKKKEYVVDQKLTDKVETLHWDQVP